MYKIKLADIETQKIFYDKLTYIYIEIPKFKKTEAELESKFEKWLYVLKNLPYLEKYPEKLQERIFKRLFEVAEISAFTSLERYAYEDSVKIYRDLKNVMDTAIEDSHARGKLEGKVENEIAIVANMYRKNQSITQIAELTDLSLSRVEEIIAGL